MKNEPKLPKEVEKRFDEEFVNKLEPHGGDGNLWPGEEGIEYWDTLKYAEDEGKVEQIKAFLAQELERQRREYVEAVEKLKYGSPKSCDESYWSTRGDDVLKSQVYFEALADVLAILKKARE